MRVAGLAGGTGGAKLLVGLDRVLGGRGDELTAVVNTGDDVEIYGVHVSPDVDIVTYWLAGIADTERGWGLRGDTFAVVDALARMDEEYWFRLGDRDFATCVYRTERLRSGAPLSTITEEIRTIFGVRPRILPMTDDRVRTLVECDDGRTLEFQDYFVREGQRPAVTGVRFSGVEDAKPAPEVLDAIVEADVVVVCPSNPIVSIGPILALPGVRAALYNHPRVVAVTPIVKGTPLKGPADKLLAGTGSEVSASGVARLYRDFCNVFVVDESDRDEISRVEDVGVKAIALDTIMSDHEASARLAGELLS